jgi:hypothetical protein
MQAKWKTRLMAGWMAATTLGLAALIVDKAASDPATVTFGTVNVQRLNVLEPDGKPRVIISNRKLFPGAYMGGREYKHFSRDTGGFLFFNDEGDEVGGLIFDNRRKAGEASASAGLSFDQYKQDETVVLNYAERNGVRSAGLSVSDRPDWPIEPVLEMSDRAVRAATQEERQKIRAEMGAYAKAKGGVGANRLFVGKEQGDSLVRLADKQGKVRLLMKVDGDGNPSIEFLDAKGKVTRRILDR